MKPSINPRLLVGLLPMLSFLFIQASCSSDDEVDINTPPEFLLTAWLTGSNYAATTYDFNQVQAAGHRTVEIRQWQNIGSLGWQSNQIYTAVYEADEHQISVQSATGYSETWTIQSRQATSMTLVNQAGSVTTWYNCSQPGWPPLIYSSMRSCR